MPGTPLTVSVYQHVAIAISKRHLHSDGTVATTMYQRAEAMIKQSTTPEPASRLYARGLEEAPGHVEARR